MHDYELSYASPEDPAWRRLMMRGIETISGRSRLLPKYQVWRRDVAGIHPCKMQEALRMIGTRLTIIAPDGWVQRAAGRPLVIVANHPFGIADGIALQAIAEQTGRPFRSLAHKGFMRVPELRETTLPIDFSATREAVKTNLATRAEARRLIKEGHIIIIFPAGGVATAENPFGRAEELPWKRFAARLIEQSEADVLPVFFEGQNSALFHFISRYSETLRLSLLVSEFRRQIGAEIKAHIGPLIPHAELAAIRDRGTLTDELYVRVHRLAPGAAHLPWVALLPRPLSERRKYPWDLAEEARAGATKIPASGSAAG